jgi:anti-anti-sigma regulatory factor
VIIDLSLTPDLDVQSLDAIGATADQLRAIGVTLWLAGVRSPVAAVLGRSGGSAEDVPTAPTIDAAIEQARRASPR